jgi:hypothetical protein
MLDLRQARQQIMQQREIKREVDSRVKSQLSVVRKGLRSLGDAGMLDTRDMYKILQKWFIECFCEPIFAKWLKMALLTTLSDITLTVLR